MKPNSLHKTGRGPACVTRGNWRTQNRGNPPQPSARISPKHPETTALPGFTRRWLGLSMAAVVLGGGLWLAGLLPMSGVLPGVIAVLLLAGLTTGGTGHEERRIRVGVRHHDDKESGVFTLSMEQETISLDHGKSWMQLDHFKWVTRGLIEAPQSLNIFPDGSVEINTEKISITDPTGPAKLESQINKQQTPVLTHKPPTPSLSQAAVTPHSDKPHFKVKLDHWGHMIIEWGHGLDREERGLRGFPTLISSGLIRTPGNYHVDPMQRAIEIDGIRYECSEMGAKQLEAALNSRYAVSARRKAVAIEIKENTAASTGFDIHFTIQRAGIPLVVKGHLSQEHLDILQDPAKCDLIQPGIQLRLLPPNLVIRRRRPDMGEEKIPELPDVNLMRTTAPQLQHVLNHSMIRRSAGGAGSSAQQSASGDQGEIAEIRVVRSLTDKSLLWLECVTSGGETLPTKAFTHHNVVELQHSGIFLPNLEVHLSLDHRKLSVHYRSTHQEETLTLDPTSSDEELRAASRLLTSVLKPAAPRVEVHRATVAAASLPASDVPPATEPDPDLHSPERPPPERSPATKLPSPGSRPVKLETPAVVAAKPELDPAIVALFQETDAVRVNLEVFRRLETWLGIPAQEVYLSLPCVFDNRRFEVLNFERTEISSLMELRGEDFYGFYLSHIKEQKVVLVYACNGTHIEWGLDKCVMQPTMRAEAEEYRASALLGMAQYRNDEFVFVVKPAFKQWITPREKPYIVENLQFRVAADIAAAPDDYRLIWPERPAAAG
ncbi:MAG: hypothetical protein IH623_15675 [Verrucomicrobia bacterium]|nr:hypothetical protein [Verrucomicrobiota bacterium]